MTGMKKLTKNKKIIIVVIIILIIIFIVGMKISSKEVEIVQQETEMIEKRTISQSVSSTGTVKTTNSKTVISSLTGYEIATVNVVEGQQISAGDVICTFDMSNVEESLSTAKSTASVSNEQTNLSIESAQRNLSDAMKSRDNQIIDAQTQVASAQSAYEKALDQLNSINTTINNKQTELATLQNTITTIPETDPTYIEIKTQIENLNLEIISLQETVSELQVQVNTLKATFDSTVSALNTITTQADSTVAAAQDNVKNAELTAESSNISQNSQLQTYEEQLEKGIVTSTIDGTVTAVNVEVGDLYTGTAIATIDGVDEFIIEAEIDEYDIADIKTGMKAYIKTDSTRDEELEGKVTYVAASATTAVSSVTAVSTTNESATYKVQITLNEQNERLRLGMNAKVSIILDSKEDVWTVPYDAVYERDDGTNYIEILKGDGTEETEKLDVEIGIEGNYYVEIISDDLKEGMEVVMPQQDSAGTSIEDLINIGGADFGI